MTVSHIFRKTAVAVLMLTSASGYAASCPLEGSWSTGFISRKASQFSKIVLTFDCAAHATMEASFLSGRMFTGRGVVYKRTGTYAVRGPSVQVPAGFLIDVVIDAHTATMLDQNSVVSESTDQDHCGDAATKLLEPESRLGRYCDDVKFPSRGFIERAVFRIDNNKLYWSPFAGPSSLIIQAPSEALRRNDMVDLERPFFRVLN